MKFHWTPKQGLSALVWDEAQKLAGKDPDFHRRDLYEAIEHGFIRMGTRRADCRRRR